ncbi:MAG: pyridoxamine 5'-phosphate oxidase family protein [Gammaproteobacteria bacterium]|nr:pyridoxamine 5'-phosphate oxidase family protein [Gammaproteobacteria bacterium]
MHTSHTEVLFTTAAQLREALGSPMELAVRKALPALDKYCKAFIQRAPFLTLSTANALGHADVSPRGDQPGFVMILDDRTLFLPERPGNARYDTLLNIIENPHVGLLFFVPGFEETLRVNGRAVIVHDSALLEQCAVNGRSPKVGIRIEVDEAYLHCAKALKRSKLWDPTQQRQRSELPTLGKMILEQTANPEAPPSEELTCTVDTYIEENYRNELY